MGVTFLMQILMTSSSEIEEASIGVSSPLVIDTRHNQSPKMTLANGTSQSPEMVVEEVMDILKFYMNTILAVMWIQQFYKSMCNWNYRKIEHIYYKAELPKISAINIKLNF